MLAAGSRLEQGATYLDLLDPTRREFTATGDMTAGDGHAYVAKKRVAYEVWNKRSGTS